MSRRDTTDSEGLAAVEQLLTDRRPSLAPDRARAIVTHSRERAGVRNRIAATKTSLVVLLACGFGLSSVGASLALSGIGTDTPSAVQAQYGAPGAGGVLGENESGGGENNGTTNPGGSGTNGSNGSGDSGTNGTNGSGDSGTNGATGSGSDTNAVQPGRQVLGSDSPAGELPFTGWAALPVLAIGLLLLGTGLIMRRRTEIRTEP